MQDEVAARMEGLGAFIRARRRVHRLSLRRLSEASGISNPYLSQIERGLRKPSADVLQQIGRALDIPVEDLYVRAGILGERTATDLVSHIRRELGLSEAQKDALIGLYQTFRGAGGADVPDPERDADPVGGEGSAAG